MTEQENRAVMTIALMAAFADGLKDERERAAIKQVADALGSQGGVDLPALYRDALIAKPDLAQLAGMLPTQASRQLAYEMAVGVCDADGAHGAAEKDFLARLAKALDLPVSVTGELDRYLIGEGTHRRLWEALGAHVDGVAGATRFAVWAPSAQRVSVVGDWNGWDGGADPMHPSDAGVWDVVVPGVTAGMRYKFEVVGADGRTRLKADPLAKAFAQMLLDMPVRVPPPLAQKLAA